jgi:hypothetical protein
VRALGGLLAVAWAIPGGVYSTGTYIVVVGRWKLTRRRLELSQCDRFDAMTAKSEVVHIPPPHNLKPRGRREHASFSTELYPWTPPLDSKVFEKVFEKRKHILSCLEG